MRSRRRALRPGDDRGVTLIELVVTIVILAIVIGPLTAAVIIYLRNTDATADRMAESHDAQIAAAYFEYDVQNTGLRDWNTPPYDSYLPSVAVGQPVNASPYGCGADTTAALVRFAWDEPADTIAGQTFRSAIYVIKPLNASVGELHRITCAGSTPSTLGVTADLTIVDNVDLTQPPSITCPVTLASCTAEVTPPGTVRMVLNIRAPGRPDSYTIELRGQRRQT